MKELLKINTSLDVSLFFSTSKDLLQLRLLNDDRCLVDREICDRAVNRPALALMGYFKHFANKRLQYLGACELSYLFDLPVDQQVHTLNNIIDKDVPCFVVSDQLQFPDELIHLFNDRKLPLFCTGLSSVEFVEKATIFFDEYFSPSTTVEGSLVEINGCGVLIQGLHPAIKSTCIMALLERGYSLVADEIVCINYAHNGYLIGRSKQLSYGFLEFRGIGLVKVSDIFGLRSVRQDTVIDFVIRFEDGVQIDRSYHDLNETKCTILDQDLPMVLLPADSGHDVHRLIEIASILLHLKRSGTNPSDELNQRLIQHMLRKS